MVDMATTLPGLAGASGLADLIPALRGVEREVHDWNGNIKGSGGSSGGSGPLGALSAVGGSWGKSAILFGAAMGSNMIQQSMMAGTADLRG